MKIRITPSVTSQDYCGFSSSSQAVAGFHCAWGEKILDRDPLRGNRQQDRAIAAKETAFCRAGRIIQFVPVQPSRPARVSICKTFTSLATRSSRHTSQHRISYMSRKVDPYITWFHRWIEVAFFAVVLAIVAILLTASAYAATDEGLFREARSNQPAITRPG